VTKLVRDLMHPGLITCRSDTVLGQVAVLLDQHHIHALIVINGDNRPIGIVSDFDLLAAEWLSIDAESLDVMRKMTAGELMTTPVNTIEAEEPAIQAAERMRLGEEHRLLVTDKGKPIGVISISDLVASMAKTHTIGRDKVAGVMSQAMLICRDTTPIANVARAMTDAGYRSVLIVDPAGSPQGIISGKDMLAYCREEDSDEVIASQVMHPALTIRLEASLREAADKMIEHHHHRLVVVDPDQPESMPLGIISTFDIVAEMAQPGSIWR